MTVDDIRKLSPEQVNRMAEIRTEIEDLESELELLIKGGKSSRRKTKKKPSSRKRAPKPEPHEVNESEPPELQEVSHSPQKAEVNVSSDADVNVNVNAGADVVAEMNRSPETSPVERTAEGAAQPEGALTRLALPKQGDSIGAELDS